MDWMNGGAFFFIFIIDNDKALACVASRTDENLCV